MTYVYGMGKLAQSLIQIFYCDVLEVISQGVKGKEEKGELSDIKGSEGRKGQCLNSDQVSSKLFSIKIYGYGFIDI